MAAPAVSKPLVRTLLDAGAAFGPLDRQGHPSLRSAGVLALARLGADDAALQDFASRQDAVSLPAPDAAAWPAGDAWAQQLGSAAAWAAYRDLMGQWLFYEDAGAVLRQTLPRLVQGCAGQGFAGLIRSAYAVQSQHRQELVDALAYWASAHLALDLAPGLRPLVPASADPQRALRQLHAVDLAARSTDAAVQALACTRAFGQAVAVLAPDAQLLQRLAALAAQAYAASGTSLAGQLLLSAWALGVLLPFADEDAWPALRQDYWHAFAALVCVADLRDAPPPQPRSWRAIVLRARSCREPHALCLVDACRALEKAYGADPLWRQAATRALWA